MKKLTTDEISVKSDSDTNESDNCEQTELMSKVDIFNNIYVFRDNDM